MLDSFRADVVLSPFEAMGAAAATLGNVGPAFGFAGPLGSYESFSGLSKGVMIALMWMGRVEIIPIIVLFTRQYWRRSDSACYRRGRCRNRKRSAG